MKRILVLLRLSLIIIGIDGHGYLFDPPQRGVTLDQLNDPYALKSIDHSGYDLSRMTMLQALRHYYGAGSYHVCGAGLGSGPLNDPHDSLTPGPIYRVYKAGSIVQMRATLSWRGGTHPGYMRLKLCKLKSPTDIVTQDCLDQNRLKIKSATDWLLNTRGQGVKAYLDDYTIQTPNFFNYRTAGQLNVFMNVQLPPGLTCDNCVIQWEYSGNNWPGTFANGTIASSPSIDNAGFIDYNGYIAGYNDTVSITQKWINCADIKIVPDPANPNQVYKPDPVPILPEIPPVYFCGDWVFSLGEMNITDPYWQNTTPDPYKYKGAGVQCLSLQGIHNRDIQCQRCKVCLDPTQICPADCYCRWYPRKLKSYSVNIVKDSWYDYLQATIAMQ